MESHLPVALVLANHNSDWGVHLPQILCQGGQGDPIVILQTHARAHEPIF
jgi:hypothetical protein